MTFRALVGNLAALASPRSEPLADIERHCDNLSEIDLKQTQKVAAHIMKMSLEYYSDARKQASRSFFAALGAAVIGGGFFIDAAWLVTHRTGDGATLSVIAGALIQVISGINFYLYSKTARQFAGFHICLERMSRYLLAYSYCENLSEAAQDSCRKTLIEIMAKAPMLTPEQVGLTGAMQEQPSSSAGGSGQPAEASSISMNQ